ncbi:MAG: MotA/TolQ/ExbB proton channel family protein [Puniceicoccales bacterium]|jgi:biopolymer transport protein TolQ|nr:MotA/TolQ/ExbB proton channel family protein [Puniceicoccales bacterium]
MSSSLIFPALFIAAGGKSAAWFIEQCDVFGQAIALLLVFCSIISICTMIQKFLELSSLRRRNAGFEQKLRVVDTIIGLNLLRVAEATPYEYLASEAGAAFQRHRGKVLNEASITLCMGHVENAIQRAIARQLVRYERRLILLTSLVSGGPFLGLLGTVYGVMIAFGGLSDKATISQLAPGVAGALVTTTCGLLVAIPATFGYNYLITQTKIMTTELENFASSLADRIELELQELLHRNDFADGVVSAPRVQTAPPAPAPTPISPAVEAPTPSFYRDEVAAPGTENL